jgi:hypothetical protein
MCREMVLLVNRRLSAESGIPTFRDVAASAKIRPRPL